MPTIIEHKLSKKIQENFKETGYETTFLNYFLWENGGMAITDRYRVFYCGELTGQRVSLPYSEAASSPEKDMINIAKIIKNAEENCDFEFKTSLENSFIKSLNGLLNIINGKNIINRRVDLVFDLSHKNVGFKFENDELIFKLELKINEIVKGENISFTQSFDLMFLTDFFNEFRKQGICWKGVENKPHILETDKYSYLVSGLR